MSDFWMGWVSGVVSLVLVLWWIGRSAPKSTQQPTIPIKEEDGETVETKIKKNRRTMWG